MSEVDEPALNLQFESNKAMIGFGLSLLGLIANLFFAVGYVGIVGLLHLTGLFLKSSDEDSNFWEDEETEIINDFKSWVHSW